MGRPDLPGGVLQNSGEIPPDRVWRVEVTFDGIEAPTPLNAAEIVAEGLRAGAGFFSKCSVDDKFGSATHTVHTRGTDATD